MGSGVPGDCILLLQIRTVPPFIHRPVEEILMKGEFIELFHSLGYRQTQGQEREKQHE